MTFQFGSPWMLLLLFSVPVLVYLVSKRDRKTRSSFRFPSRELADGLRPTWRVRGAGTLKYLKAAGLVLIVLALARPQASIEKTRVYIEGIDIVLAVDVSSSMRAMDFRVKGERVNRLQVVKDVVSDFIGKRTNDRIGLVAFSALAYTVCPLTLDHDWLEKNLERVRIGMIEDGTAIGSAISAAVNRLRDTEAKEKIVILLTDGRNNAGRISPLAAAEAARALGIKIYTIGAGTKGLAPYPMKDTRGNTVVRPVEIRIDDELLKKIAETTDGRYYRATDTRSLVQIYDEIDKLEKTRMEQTGYNLYRELFGYFLIPGLILLLCEMVLSNTVFRRIP
ncbi:MAG: VWA domain-containing protein [Candidatus Omnitrophica bacterium]|nr:VWA domain-containing protein [Candidatus Omnitrophota bacterium]